MKILLLTPIYFIQRWPLDLYFTKLFFELSPLGLYQLAAYYPKKTEIINGINNKKINPKKRAKIFQNYNSEHDVIGISCQANVGAINSILTLKLARKFAPNSTIIVGGYHATFFDTLWVKMGADIVIKHEAELIYKRILSKINQNQKFSHTDLTGTTYSLLYHDANPINTKDIINLIIDLLFNPLNYISIFKRNSIIHSTLRTVRLTMIKNILYHFFSFRPRFLANSKKYI